MRIRSILTVAATAILFSTAAIGRPPAAGKAMSASTFSVRDAGEHRLEVTSTGVTFTSRDALEGALLLKAARLTLERGQGWFRLLHLPGERPGVHPARTNAGFGAKYGHWQPHWNYFQAGEGWQPWHPEWSAPFWTREVDRKNVERFELHAMIELGRGPLPRIGQTAFNAAAVRADLEPRYGRAAD